MTEEPMSHNFEISSINTTHEYLLKVKLVYHFWKRETQKIGETFHQILIQIVALEIVWNVQKSVCHMTESYYRLFRSGLSEFYNREAVTMRFDVIWRDFEHEQRLNSEGNWN